MSLAIPVSSFFNWLPMPGSMEYILDLYRIFEIYQKYPNWSVFLKDGPGHTTMEFEGLLIPGIRGTRMTTDSGLHQWVRSLLEGNSNSACSGSRYATRQFVEQMCTAGWKDQTWCDEKL
eukprot:TRINITY_DN28275_c0_g1_i1.p1 TRINITY_DN28275_c0_g1~~TRINITY_DN28275_c0_g1_i1.p1  ORF type:complete len:119 (-),score=17.93 TRINITY_DN28275_c0_g1_i1:63-419(-)